MRKVLIAHQSTIPHYRVPFYNTLERLRSSSWQFDVVFDPSEIGTKQFFKESLDFEAFQFPILAVKTFSSSIASKTVSYQTFWKRAGRYDLIIVENAVNNLTYPLAQLHQLRGIRFAYWGHGRDRSAIKPSVLKSLLEKLKLLLARGADGFFAYTSGIKQYLELQGLSSQKIFVVNNTIDIDAQRLAFEEWYPRRETVRQELGVRGKKVLLFVGRFTENRRVDFLLESFSALCEMDSRFHLLLVGSGGRSYLPDSAGNISYFGPITKLDKLAQIYVASDVFAFPGAVGLGPLQALCYDLPVFTIDSNVHGPEIEYLSQANSVILNINATPTQYARSIDDFFKTPTRLSSFKASIWSSIEHLTINQMACNFIDGVNTILGV